MKEKRRERTGRMGDEGEEREKGRKGEMGKKEKGRELEEERDQEVKKDSTKQRKRTIQIFVQEDGSKVAPMEVSLTDDKVQDVMKRSQKDEDAYVTTQGEC